MPKRDVRMRIEQDLVDAVDGLADRGERTSWVEEAIAQRLERESGGDAETLILVPGGKTDAETESAPREPVEPVTVTEFRAQAQRVVSMVGQIIETEVLTASVMGADSVKPLDLQRLAQTAKEVASMAVEFEGMGGEVKVPESYAERVDRLEQLTEKARAG